MKEWWCRIKPINDAQDRVLRLDFDHFVTCPHDDNQQLLIESDLAISGPQFSDLSLGKFVDQHYF